MRVSCRNTTSGSKLLLDVPIVVGSSNYLDFPWRILELGYFPKSSESRGLGCRPCSVSFQKLLPLTPGDPPFLSSSRGTHLSPCLPPRLSFFLMVLPKARVAGPHRGLQREEGVLEGGSGLPHTLGFCSYPRLVGKWSQVDPTHKPRASSPGFLQRETES